MLDDPGVDDLVRQWTEDHSKAAESDEINRIASEWLADVPVQPHRGSPASARAAATTRGPPSRRPTRCSSPPCVSGCPMSPPS